MRMLISSLLNHVSKKLIRTIRTKKPKFKIKKTLNHAFKYNLSQKPNFPGD